MGAPVDVRTAFEHACRRAKITDFRFHDLRHPCASWPIIRGRSLKEVQEILGHREFSLTLRYAHLSPDRLREAVAALEDFRGGSAQKSAQSGKLDPAPLASPRNAGVAQWQSAGELAALTTGGEPSAWMFPTSTGTLIEVVAIGKRFRLVLRKGGLPAFRLYDLRHTYATHLLAEGAPITYVAAQLGHAKATTTLAHCAHWIPEDNKCWVDRLAARREAESEKFGTKVGTKPGSEAEGVLELPAHRTHDAQTAVGCGPGHRARGSGADPADGRALWR